MRPQTGRPSRAAQAPPRTFLGFHSAQAPLEWRSSSAVQRGLVPLRPTKFRRAPTHACQVPAPRPCARVLGARARGAKGCAPAPQPRAGEQATRGRVREFVRVVRLLCGLPRGLCERQTPRARDQTPRALDQTPKATWQTAPAVSQIPHAVDQTTCGRVRELVRVVRRLARSVREPVRVADD